MQPFKELLTALAMNLWEHLVWDPALCNFNAKHGQPEMGFISGHHITPRNVTKWEWRDWQYLWYCLLNTCSVYERLYPLKHDWMLWALLTSKCQLWISMSQTMGNGRVGETAGLADVPVCLSKLGVEDGLLWHTYREHQGNLFFLNFHFLKLLRAGHQKAPFHLSSYFLLSMERLGSRCPALSGQRQAPTVRPH